ncbi:MAG: pyridoxal phosphate-dependent aminotransferase [Acidobacteriota bacterium]
MRAIAAQFSVPEHKLLDFSASIYPGGPSPHVLEALADAIRNPASIRAYPDLESLELRKNLANYVNVPVGNVLVANGMVPLLSATLRAIGVRKCMLPAPAFGEYSRALHRDGVTIETSRLTEEANFRPDIIELLARCARRGCDTLILTNPHNPTGAILQRADLQVLVRNAETCGIRILLDEAFIDFVPEESVSARVLQSSNLFVFRSVTKFFGMAGVRVAYMIAPQPLVSAIADRLDPWAISTLASLAAIAAVSDTVYIANAIVGNRHEREMLSVELAALGLTVYPSQANFLFFRLSNARRNRNVWERLILKHGIVVRNCAMFEGLDEMYFRVAVRSREDNQRFVRALYAVLNDVA